MSLLVCNDSTLASHCIMRGARQILHNEFHVCHCNLHVCTRVALSPALFTLLSRPSVIFIISIVAPTCRTCRNARCSKVSEVSWTLPSQRGYLHSSALLKCPFSQDIPGDERYT